MILLFWEYLKGKYGLSWGGWRVGEVGAGVLWDLFKKLLGAVF